MLLSEQTHMVDLYIHDKVSKVQMALVICLTWHVNQDFH